MTVFSLSQHSITAADPENRFDPLRRKFRGDGQIGVAAADDSVNGRELRVTSLANNRDYTFHFPDCADCGIDFLRVPLQGAQTVFGSGRPVNDTAALLFLDQVI